ncbi:hypothetical protein HMPREF9622_02797 [Cutibacterium modestum HL037PA3]|uniref:Uncharacterized protein n=1 Tax=Cutibacterium modestum HL044PA1 TaxID=765109 RepID=A0ABP2K7E7_9ACTN|nr:hypothetical protein HMPREF9607_01690 [Cutibacterium modestum HL044PA1]EFT14160.1 hypothetical protein HMPREF9622_02797 [Cutibacterium modestum HL037PA3]
MQEYLSKPRPRFWNYEPFCYRNMMVRSPALDPAGLLADGARLEP